MSTDAADVVDAPFPVDAGPPPLAIPTPGVPMPERLSALGLIVDGAPHPALHSYVPDHPLWTNGSDKRRLLYLPEGTRVAVEGAFAFPVGTTLFKEFAYDDRRVETRVMRLAPEGWEYFVYVWAGDDATLLDAAIPTDVEVDTADGPLTHVVPSNRNCRTCHESGDAGEVLGFAPRQLGGSLDDLVARGVFEARPADPPPIAGRDALETSVMRYVVGNCVHCHNGGSGAATSFDLRPEVFVDAVVGAAVENSAAPSGVRVVPGDPDASVLFTAFTRENEFVMPPIGVQRVDGEALEMLRAWISSLP